MSEIAPVSAQLVLVVAACVLFYTAFADLARYQIRNELVLTLIGLFVVHAILSGHWVSIHWNIVLAVIMFFVLLYFYAHGQMGGGDLKLLTVAFLWVGMDCALLFSVVLLALSGVQLMAVQFGWLGVRTVDGRRSIAFAPVIAGALIAVFMSGCLSSS